MKLRFTLAAAILGLALPNDAFAQIEAELEPTTFDVSIIPVGISSDSRWVGKGVKMRAIAIDPGAAPPRPIFLTQSAKEKVELNFSLNSASERFPLKQPIVQLNKQTSPGTKDSPPTFAPYNQKNLGNRPGAYSVVYARAHDQKDWKKPISMTLNDNYDVFPKGSIRFINLSPIPVAVKIGSSSPQKLSPGKTIIWKTSEFGSHQLKIGYQDKKKEIHYTFNSQVRVTQESRMNLCTFPVPQKTKPMTTRGFTTPPPITPPPLETTPTPQSTPG